MKLALDNSNKALEITMRDVMDNLEDAASYTALHCSHGFEILSIEPPVQEAYTITKCSKIVFLNKY
jgi:hypothetical protein